MHVGVIGINHKLADLKLREQLAKACHKWFHPLQASCEELRSCILLSTCNRTEIYFSASNLAEMHSYLLNMLRVDSDEAFEHKLYSYFGVDCFNHLARVTAGLDSAIIGETEIQGQVKTAYEQVSHIYKIPSSLHIIFQKSLSIGKKIRNQFSLGNTLPSIEQAIFQTGMHFFSDLNQVKILFIGASEINCKILNYFWLKKINDITICNRTDDAARLIAENKNLQILNWSSFDQWHAFDWLIFGTKCPHYLLTEKNLPLDFSNKLIIDLSVPRNVDPKLCKDPRMTLWNIDQINRLLQIKNRNLNKILKEAEKKVALMAQELNSRYLLKDQIRIQHFQDSVETELHPGYYPYLSQIG